MNKLSPKTVLRDFLNSKDEKVRFYAAKVLLDEKARDRRAKFLEQKKFSEKQLQKILNKVMEIILRHVKDQQILEGIAHDLKKITSTL